MKWTKGVDSTQINFGKLKKWRIFYIKYLKMPNIYLGHQMDLFSRPVRLQISQKLSLDAI